MGHQEAWVITVRDSVDARKSLVLATSLRRTLTTREIVVFTYSNLNSIIRIALHQVFDNVFVLDKESEANEEESQSLWPFYLKQYQKLIFISPNVMFLRNHDSAFDLLEDDTTLTLSNGGYCRVSNLALLGVASAYLQEHCRGWTGIENWSLGQLVKERNAKKLDSHFVQLKVPDGVLNIIEADPAGIHFQTDPLELLKSEWNDESAVLTDLGKLGILAIRKWLGFYRETAKLLLEDTCLQKRPMMNPVDKKDPIAIVGMSCTYPGSNGLEEFWSILVNGVDATGKPPHFRWTNSQTPIAVPGQQDMNCGFLSIRVEEFDAKFFGISPSDAIYMDPQTRLLLETTWKGFEDAGIYPEMLKGTNGGVFVGSWKSDFYDILNDATCADFYRKYIGTSAGAAAARISMAFGLTGPAIATESGCSSSMVAVHMACKSLQSGESSIAAACGVNLLLNPFNESFMPAALSPEGLCKTFDAQANGFARAEGCGVLVLKRLSDAVRDNDRIWGILRGSAVAQEGLSPSMGTPTVAAEALSMTRALEDAQLGPEHVSYVEAHGTGTRVGDPTEVAAIAKAYSTSNRGAPLILGSVKTNVGHTESVSGITGIMKVVLAMHHQLIPAHRNFEKLNPAIDLEAIPAVIPLKPVEWGRSPACLRFAGVSSFGITGTDVHVILQEPPTREHPTNSSITPRHRDLHIFKISGKTKEALGELMNIFAAHLEVSSDPFQDIAYTANIGRPNFSHRGMVIAGGTSEAVEVLRSGKMLTHEVKANRSEPRRKLCFLFTGQGSQYPGMAKELYETSPVFRLHSDLCERVFRKRYNINIMGALYADGDQTHSQIGRTTLSQPSIFCVEYALFKLWESWGVVPDYVLGHSSGEFAGSVAAGILTLEDGIKLVAERSRLVDSLPEGKMLVVKANEDAVSKLLADCQLDLEIAAINSEDQIVVAGDSNDILQFARVCKAENLKVVLLEATHAFHSKHMNPILDEYKGIASSVARPLEETVIATPGYISGVSGTLVKPCQVDSSYWVAHTRDKVNFIKPDKQRRAWDAVYTWKLDHSRFLPR